MDGLPSELYLTCMNRLGLPYLLFDADEILIFANEPAFKTVPALREARIDGLPSSSTVHSSALFRYAAFDMLDLSSATFQRDGKQPSFSLATVFAERVHAPAAAAGSGSGTGTYPEMDVDRDDHPTQATECHPYMRLVDDIEHLWRKANISNFSGPNERSYYYSMLLFDTIFQKGPPTIRALPPASSVEALERPPLHRTISDPPAVPQDVEGLTQATTEMDAQAEFSLDFYKSAVESMPEILFTSAKDGIITFLNPQWYTYTGWPQGEATRELWANVYVYF